MRATSKRFGMRDAGTISRLLKTEVGRVPGQDCRLIACTEEQKDPSGFSRRLMIICINF